MSRSKRLLDLLQLLREYRNPVSAQTLSKKLEVSVRTVYRDIETLRQQGANIDGEVGLGYQLRDGYLLPPLMFDVDELEALVLGSRWVQNHGDEKLVSAATKALAKINGVIPKSHQSLVESHALFVPSFNKRGYQKLLNPDTSESIRQAIRLQKVCHIFYKDGKGKASERTIYPFGLTFFDEVQVVMAWCCLREDFRHFRVDRIQSIQVTAQTYSPNKQTLLQDWQRQECIDVTIVQNF